ncbi:MAG: LLM class flavin-dependent oxidoreductase [SAR202 cluster bacterium]|nr:LLM class flavin-dependent oxidoreductase [SAR202 cluster bacterium]
MDIGIGLDGSLGLTWQDQETLAQEAARLGYTSIWTPEGNGEDSFHLCAYRWNASRQVTPGGLATGIAVSPVMYRTPMAFAMSGGTLSQMTGGKFFMGLGAGSFYRPRTSQTVGLDRISALAMMRDYVTTIKQLVAGQQVDYDGEVVTLHGMKLAMNPPPKTPVYLGALGPEMLRLAGELADGVCLNWCNPEQIDWSRQRIAEGADRAGRNPAEVKVVEYIRVCVDDDEAAARRAYARATMHYALGSSVPTARERRQGYRAHFERMGHAEELLALDQMRKEGAPSAKVVEGFSADLLKSVGYYGPAEGAAAAFKNLSQGLDTAVVRVVSARKGIDSVLAVMRACRPELVEQA